MKKQFINLGSQFPNVLNKYQLGELDDELGEYNTTVLLQSFSKFKSIETLNNDVDQFWWEIGKLKMMMVMVMPNFQIYSHLLRPYVSFHMGMQNLNSFFLD